MLGLLSCVVTELRLGGCGVVGIACNRVDSMAWPSLLIRSVSVFVEMIIAPGLVVLIVGVDSSFVLVYCISVGFCLVLVSRVGSRWVSVSCVDAGGGRAVLIVLAADVVFFLVSVPGFENGGKVCEVEGIIVVKVALDKDELMLDGISVIVISARITFVNT